MAPQNNPATSSSPRTLPSRPTSPQPRQSPKPKKSILRRGASTDRQRLIPRFENEPHLSTFPQTCNVAQSGKIHKRYSQPPRSLPAILAQLREQYSEEQLRKVPPVFMPSLKGRSACLGEPYAVTLNRAAKSGRGVIVSATKKNRPDPPAPITARRSPRVAFAPLDPK